MAVTLLVISQLALLTLVVTLHLQVRRAGQVARARELETAYIMERLGITHDDVQAYHDRTCGCRDEPAGSA